MSETESKFFTVDEANKTLPLVRVIVKDLAVISKRVEEKGRRLEHLVDGRDLSQGDPYAEELADMKASIARDSEKMREFEDELLALGIEPGETTAGVADFPAMHEGEHIYLCWQYDEPEVLFWRAPGDAFEGRRRLTADSLPGDSASDSAL